jgi:hypothetical protein
MQYILIMQDILFECPKCNCEQTKITGKESYSDAIGKLIIGFITAFLGPLIIFIKILIYLCTSRFNKIRKMIVQELWGKYVLCVKYLLIILTFGIYNITRKCTCEKCGEKWVV